MFSIIVPIYNTEKYLCQCIDSVLQQTYKDYKLILVDDGSTDKSADICEKYGNKDTRIKVIHKKNGGLSDARNVGMENAEQAEYLMFLDSDDYWDDKNALNDISKIIMKKHPDAVRYPFKKFYQDKVIFKRGIFKNTSSDIKEMLKNGVYCASAWCWALKASVLRDNGMKFVVGQLSEDIEWCTKMLYHFKSFEIYNNDFYIYRQQNSSSITSNVKICNLEHITDVLVRYAVKNQPVEIYNFLAKQLVLLLTTISRVKDNQKISILLKLKKIDWLLNYDLCPHVKLTRYINDVVGLKNTSKILGIAYYIKNIK